jgi:hypothetical protein
MKRKNYFPGALALQRAWLVNFKAKIAVYGHILGLTDAEITKKQDAAQAIIDAIDDAEAAITASKVKNKAKNLVMKENMTSIRASVANMKTNTAYTQDIGIDMGIVGEESEFDPDKAKTIVKLTKAPQGVDIKFTLEGCEGGNIYCKRGNETAFTFIKYVIHPHTIDTRPNLDGAASEQRQYYVILVLDDEEVGIPSDIATTKN